MLKWLLAIVVLALVSWLGSSLSQRRWRLGRLPGHLHFDVFGRHIHIRLTSRLLLPLLVAGTLAFMSVGLLVGSIARTEEAASAAEIVAGRIVVPSVPE